MGGAKRLKGGISAAAMLIAATAMGSDILISGNGLDQSSGFGTAMASLGQHLTYVSPFNFGTTSLAGFNMVYLNGFSQYSPGTAGNPGLVASTLQSFMNGGGTVFVENPGFGSESLSLYPYGGQLTATFTNPPGQNVIQIVKPSSYVNAGLTNAGLSGWSPSAYGFFGSSLGSFTGITDDGTAGEWITVTRNVGSGHLVYTQQGLSARLTANPTDAQGLRFISNIIPVPEPSSLLFLGLAVPYLVHRRRTRRK